MKSDSKLAEEGEGSPLFFPVQLGSTVPTGAALGSMPSDRLSCSIRELVRPGYRRPTYAPRVIRSSSVSPGLSASRLRERMWDPKTIARCSFVSTLFLYTCNHISCPVVVGILVRTSHSTTGSVGRRFGPRESVAEVSTGMERGGRGREGVEKPGVAGGVKAGEIRDGGTAL